MISFGHRNPQGLKFVKGENLIINSEHGPKGGDEINFNYLDKTSEEKIMDGISHLTEHHIMVLIYSKNPIVNMVLLNLQFILPLQ